MSQSQQGPERQALTPGQLETTGRVSGVLSVVSAVIGLVQAALVEGAQPWVIPVVVVLALVSAGAVAAARAIDRAGRRRLPRVRRATTTIVARDGTVAGYGFLVADQVVLTTADTVGLALGRRDEDEPSTGTPARPAHSVLCRWETALDHPLTADVTYWGPQDGGSDVVLLRLDDDELPPAGAAPVSPKTPWEGAPVTVDVWAATAALTISGVAHQREPGLWSVPVHGADADPARPVAGAPVAFGTTVLGYVTGRVTDGDSVALVFREARTEEIRTAVASLPAGAAGAAGAAAGAHGSAGAPPGDRPPRDQASRRHVGWWPLAAAATALVLALVLIPVIPGGPGDAAPPPCEGTPVAVNVVVGTEKDALVGDLADTFAETYRYEDTRCAHLHVSGVSSGVAKAALVDGWTTPPENTLAPGTPAPVPDAWLPTSSVWPRLMAAQGEDAALAENWETRSASTSVASSVLGILMTEEKRDAHFGGEQPTWRELVDAAAAEELTLAVDDPVNSTSGMANSVALNESLSDEDEEAKVNTLRDAVASVPEDLAGQEITLLMKSLDDNPELLAQVDAVVAQEQTAHLFNCGSPLGESPMTCADRRTDPAERLVVVQPADATYAFDHPVIHLAASDGSPEKQAVITAFADYLATDGHAREEFERWGFRPPDDPGTVTDVLDENVSAATPSGIADWPDAATIGAYQEQWQSVRLPVRVHLSIDNSGSMRGPASRVSVPGFVDACTGETVDDPDYLQLARNAALDAVERLDDGRDSVALDAFPRPSGWAPVTLRQLDGTVRSSVRDAVCALDGKGNSTPLYPTIRDAQETMSAQRDRPGPRSSTAIVVLSDGAQQPPDDLGGLLDDIGGEAAEPVISVAIGPEAPIDDLQMIGDETSGTVRDLRAPEAVGDLDTVLVDVFSGLVGK